jgi:transcriptional regulator with XRE-family HTH domain
MSYFSERLSELLVESNRSAAHLAKDIGLVRSTVSNFKHGDGYPSAETLRKIADYFDVSIDYLVGRTSNPRQNSDFPLVNGELSEIGSLYSQLSKRQQDQVIAFIQGLLSK